MRIYTGWAVEPIRTDLGTLHLVQHTAVRDARVCVTPVQAYTRPGDALRAFAEALTFNPVNN